MKRCNLWIILLVAMTGLLGSACRPANVATAKVQPASVEPIEGTDRKQVVLVESAVGRIGIETDTVREEQVTRTRTIGGQVEAGEPNEVLVSVSFNVDDMDEVAHDQPAIILPFLPNEEIAPVTAERVEMETGSEPDAITTTLYYRVDSPDHGLVPGQRVNVDLPLHGNGMQGTVIPYDAVIYGLEGETWIYTNPEPLTYVLQPISIDFIAGNLAVLSDGPPAGTQVVTAGAAELYGAEFGVGK